MPSLIRRACSLAASLLACCDAYPADCISSRYSNWPRPVDYLSKLHDWGVVDKVVRQSEGDIGWVKFTIRHEEEGTETTYFQNSTRYLFHSSFQVNHEELFPELSNFSCSLVPDDHCAAVDTYIRTDAKGKFTTGTIGFDRCQRRFKIGGGLAFTISSPLGLSVDEIQNAANALRNSIHFFPDHVVYFTDGQISPTTCDALRDKGILCANEKELLGD